MRVDCPRCNLAVNATITCKNNSDWYMDCPICKQKTKISIPETTKPIIMAFSKEVYCEPLEWYETDICAIYGFDEPEELIDKWHEVLKDYEGFWYYIIHSGMAICSGVCDPNDEEIIIEYFDLSQS